MHHGIIFSLFHVEYPIQNENPSPLVTNTGIYQSENRGLLSAFGHSATEWRGQSSRGPGSHKIASHLRDLGNWDVEVIDYWSAFTLDDLKRLVDMRITKKTIFVGFSQAFASYHGKQLHLEKYIKDNYPWVATVAGSIGLIAILNTSADYHVVGRGEYGMEALCKHLTNSGSVKIKEITHPYSGDKVFKVIDCKYDYPAEPKSRVKVSYEERDLIESNETLTMELSRGCRFKCSFCDYYPLGVKGDWTRDVDDFESELRENYDRWGITNYLLTDETINDRTEKLEKFGAVVKTLPFTPRFHGYMRADLLIHRGQRELDAVKQLNVAGHWYGVESLNHKTAKSVGKGMASDRMKEGLLQLDKDFVVNMSFILGLPHESIESMRSTMRWITDNFNHRQVHMYPLSLDDPSQTIDLNSKIEESGAYEWVYDNNLTRVWKHPTENYTHKDMVQLEDEFYNMKYDAMPHIWSLAWMTVLGLDPDVVYNDRVRPQGEYFPASCQDIWDAKLERYRIAKLSL